MKVEVLNIHFLITVPYFAVLALWSNALDFNPKKYVELQASSLIKRGVHHQY